MRGDGEAMGREPWVVGWGEHLLGAEPVVAKRGASLRAHDALAHDAHRHLGLGEGEGGGARVGGEGGGGGWG